MDETEKSLKQTSHSEIFYKNSVSTGMIFLRGLISSHLTVQGLHYFH